MIRRLLLSGFRLAATILVTLSLIVSAQAAAATPFSGPLMAVEICHEDSVTVIWLDAEGEEHPVPAECRDCCLCALPHPYLPKTTMLAAPQAILGGFVPQLHPRTGMVACDHRSPPARGPPFPQSRTASA